MKPRENRPVKARSNRFARVRRAGPIGAIAGIAVLSVVSIAPGFLDKTSQHAAPTGVAGAIPSPGTTLQPGVAASPGAGPAFVAPPRPGLACARGRNGGATDVGVTGGSIKLAATVVKSGIGASFLGEVPIALEAVKNKINRAGGVCGRLLDLTLVDDEWRADLGERYIRNFIAENTFALAVSPSSEGLDAAIRNGDITRAGIPVVGADGMLISQYTEPWVWPVAASTISAMHVIAQEAVRRGAHTFGLVYDKSYHFGVEGAAAFRGALRRLSGGGALRGDIGIDAGQPSYKTDVDRFNRACSPCDFVAMLLEPGSALQWIKDGGSFGSLGTGGPQPLFVDSFARSCGAACNGMMVWTGYTPPLSPFDSEPRVAAYVNDMRAQSATVDVSNPFVEGGYVGMSLLVEALRRVGPDLTRARLRAVLDSMRYDSGLSTPLGWQAGSHFANVSLQAYSIVVNAGSFSGWRYERTDWVRDRWIGRDAPS